MDLVDGADRLAVARRVAEDPVAEHVEVARDAGPDLARTQQAAVLGGRSGKAGVRTAGPAGGQAGVQQPAEVHRVLLLGLRVVVGVDAGAQGRERAEPDQLDATRLRHHDGVGSQPSVREADAVRVGHRRRHLAHQPGGPARRERTFAQHHVERLAGGPLADDVGQLAVVDGVEHLEDAGVDDAGRTLGRGEQVGGVAGGRRAGSGGRPSAPGSCRAHARSRSPPPRRADPR